jgi:mannose-1-phosphate guanylyltransferase/mannose-6-phosphate isomerase
MIVPVLLSGGVGSRLWPVSRELYPKQFLPLVGGGASVAHGTSADALSDQNPSMLQQTYFRLDGLDIENDLIVVCNEEHRFLVAEQMRGLNTAATIILESEGKNTAPAVALAALQALKQDKDAVLLVLPADHVILDNAKFHAAVMKGLEAADNGELVAFGVIPDKPETGYGYIQRGDSISASSYRIQQFVEKPDSETARQYCDSGEYYWNSGMFLLQATTYLEELQKYAPAMVEACQQAFDLAQTDMDFVRINAEAFARSPSDSIDYAVMEHTQKGAVIPLDCGWSDVGSWSTLWEVESKNECGNVLKGDVLVHDVSNSYIRSESRMVAAVGVDDMVIVETADAVLISDKHNVQHVKKIVQQLQAQGRGEITAHTKVYRPWGTYESLVDDGRFQVKRIVVKPGHTLSLQMHHHRAEHWIVVKGTAKIVNDDKELLLGEDQSTYIPLGHRHRLANPGVIPLEIIEVQTGSYLGEDDIVRFDDVYGR